jgi:hypothetical protein
MVLLSNCTSDRYSRQVNAVSSHFSVSHRRNGTYS